MIKHKLRKQFIETTFATFPKQHQPPFAGQPNVDEKMQFHKLNPNQTLCCRRLSSLFPFLEKYLKLKRSCQGFESMQ